MGERGDITTQALFSEDDVCRARLVVRENGIVAGMQEILYFLRDADSSFRPRLGNIAVNILKNDGEEIVAGDVILELRGQTRDVLAVERVLVNLVGRMSGVATLTREFVKRMSVFASPESEFLVLTATRKTLWGLLDKRAVCVGGGFPHRLNLEDAMLVKDNHLALFQGEISALLEKISSFDGDQRFLEIEVESVAQALSVASAVQRIHTKSSTKPIFLLLDNMSPAQISETVELLKKGLLYDEVFLEASGGITLKNIPEYAKTGVDVISSGSLTTNARSLNLSLEVSVSDQM